MLALFANLLNVLLLVPPKDGNTTIRSVWLCYRNDAISDVAVMIAAAVVRFTAFSRPDLILATGMARLFTGSAFQIVCQTLRERRGALETA